MKKKLLRLMLIFIIAFIGTSCIMFLDNICMETTGEGGKLVLDVENWTVFH